MASIHVLDRIDAGHIRVVVHAPVPNTTNSAGVNWRTALLNSGLGGTTILKTGDGAAGTITAAELASIQAGSLFEASGIVVVDTLPGGQVNAWLDSEAARLIAEAQANLQFALKFYGAAR